jgi:hypothetical protein
MLTRTGTCACGQLRVTCKGDPVMVSQCHCLDCQKRTGSTYGIGSFFYVRTLRRMGFFELIDEPPTAALR